MKQLKFVFLFYYSALSQYWAIYPYDFNLDIHTYRIKRIKN